MAYGLGNHLIKGVKMTEKKDGFSWQFLDEKDFNSAKTRHAELSQGEYSEPNLLTKWLILLGEFPIAVIKELIDFLRDEKRGKND